MQWRINGVKMNKCPVCKQEVPGYNWTKTAKGKNWLQNSAGKWHSCPNNERKPSKRGYMWGCDSVTPSTPTYYFVDKSNPNIILVTGDIDSIDSTKYEFYNPPELEECCEWLN